jgi:hypothetical protein
VLDEPQHGIHSRCGTRSRPHIACSRYKPQLASEEESARTVHYIACGGDPGHILAVLGPAGPVELARRRIPVIEHAGLAQESRAGPDGDDVLKARVHPLDELDRGRRRDETGRTTRNKKHLEILRRMVIRVRRYEQLAAVGLYL